MRSLIPLAEIPGPTAAAAGATFAADAATDAATTAPARRTRVLAALVAVLAVTAAMFGVAGPAEAKAPATHARTSYEYAVARGVVTTLNNERRAHHLRPLTMNKYLNLSARRHNVTMARYNTMSHQLPREAFFANRMTSAGYRWHYAGENIAWNSRISTAGVQQLQVMMYNEKAPNNDHRLNILNKHFKDVGVDVYVDTAHHKVWLTTDFGAH